MTGFELPDNLQSVTRLGLTYKESIIYILYIKWVANEYVVFFSFFSELPTACKSADFFLADGISKTLKYALYYTFQPVTSLKMTNGKFVIKFE